METGIYEILNTKNKKWYRGQVQADYGFDGRFNRHKQYLKAGNHWNDHLQKAWDKYGEGAFKFTILSRCAAEFCNELEEYFIGEDYNNPAISYNKMAGGGACGSLSGESKVKISEAQKGENNSMYGKRHSEASKKKMSEAQKGKYTGKNKCKYKGANNHQYAPFTVTFPDGRIERWENTREAGKAYGVVHSCISKYLNDKNKPGKHPPTAHLKDTNWQYV